MNEDSGYENVVTTLAHSDFGGPDDCCGCLNGIVNGDLVL